MPWFPDFVSAAELSRAQTRDEGHADPVAQYLNALSSGDARGLDVAWPGNVEIHDPRAGLVRGHTELREFVGRNMSWLSGLHARVETVASTTVGRRAVVELLAHLDSDGRTVDWPVAVLAESPDDRSVIFRTYCSQLPVDGRRHLRPSILEPGRVALPGAVARYQAALRAGDVDAATNAFTTAGYLREPFGSQDLHRGPDELRAYFTSCFGAGGGIELEPCTVTDDGARCAVEYNCVRWGGQDVPPQAGVAVYERGADDLLAAVRVYDDVEPSVASR